MAIRSLIAISIFASAALPVAAEPNGDTQVYCDRDLGYHFYCDPDKAVSDPVEEVPVESEVVVAPSASERLETERAIFDEAKAAMVLDPTPANVER